MKHLIIDTETSGLFDFKLAADDPSQPRLAHLAMIYADEEFNVEAVEDFYVRPDGWKMEPDATAVNGLTDEFLAEHGVGIAEVLQAYSLPVVKGRAVIAFNAQFDCKVMRGEFRRAGLPDLFEQTNNVCVMRPMVKLCGLKQPGSNRSK